MKKIAIICVTDNGDEISESIKKKLSGKYVVDIYHRQATKEMKIKNVVEQVFYVVDYIIFISSTGIAVRSIADFIKSKVSDPGVIVIDNKMQYAISLIGGHLGGANRLCEELHEELNVIPIITTATDNLSITAPDVFAKDNNLIIDDMKKCKEVASLLVNGGKVSFMDDTSNSSIPKGYLKYQSDEKYEGVMVVTNKSELEIKNANCVLKLIPKNLVLGIGCRKDYSVNTMIENAKNLLEKMNIDERSITSIGTAWVKEKEKAIKALSEYFNCPMKIFTKEEIEKVQEHYKGSDFVMKTIGVKAVCEPCVELLGGSLMTDKISLNGMTICMGKID